MRKFQANISGPGPLTAWPEILTSSEEKLLRAYGGHREAPDIRIHMYQCRLSDLTQTRALWGGRGLLGLGSTLPCLILLLCHVIIAPCLPSLSCRASCPRHWTGCQTGPKKPRSSWCSSATWSSRSRYLRQQHLRQAANLIGQDETMWWGRLFLLCYLYVLWGKPYFFSYALSLPLHTNTNTDQLLTCSFLRCYLCQ